MGKSLIPEGKWSRLTLLWSFSQFVVISIIECIIIYLNFKNKDVYVKKIEEYNILHPEDRQSIGNFTALIVYQFLYIVALAYQLYLTVDTLLKFSTIDLIALAVFNSMCLVYSITQNLQNEKFKNITEEKTGSIQGLYKSTNFEYVNIAIMLVFTLGWWYITFRLYKVFGWNVFKQIGADIKLKKRLKLFNIFVTLMKLDIFFVIFLFIGQYFVLVLYHENQNNDDNNNNNNNNQNDEDNSNNQRLWDLAIPIAIIIGTLIGFIAISKKNRVYLGIYIFTLCATMGFMSHVLVDTFNKDSTSRYENSRISLTVTIAISLLTCMVTYVVSLINFKNFGLGIPKSLNKSTVQSGQSDNNKQKRLSID